MYRQGDVLLLPVSSAPGEVVESGDQIVLVLGEATGHAHVLHAPGLERLRTRRADFVRVGADAELRHDEHHTIAIPPGTYRIVRQREYVPQARSSWIGDLPRLPWVHVED